MGDKIKFSPKDIGAELLPIITKGLYRDPLDALREYIQNSIDANAKSVKVLITSDLVSIRDDGNGMSRDVAKKAIRLGMSEKNPTEDVGFRGIGIYSGFNICNRLEIFTKTKDSDSSKILFDFKTIQESLADEEERRFEGKPSDLNLSELLSQAVTVETPEKCPIEKSGTLVMMIGLKGEVLDRLSDEEEVKEYLQATVPLPFHPSFKYKKQIEEKFENEDYRIINLMLNTEDPKSHLYRAYSNEMFTHEKGNGPRFYEVKNKLGKGKLGFAWVCLNDARKYLPNQKLRGLLIKKFGFSVGDRKYFAPFFSRPVYNNRITGEIIITNKELLPNASRTEFEPGPLRDSFYYACAKIAQEITQWGDQVQNELKANEELDIISPKVFEILNKIKASEREVDRLLLMNNELGTYTDRLMTHRKTLDKLNKKLLDKTQNALDEAKKQITEILKSQQKAIKGKRKRILRASNASIGTPTQKELFYAEDRPKNINEVIQALDIDIGQSMGLLIDHIDQEYIQQKMDKREYVEFLEELIDFMEGSM